MFAALLLSLLAVSADADPCALVSAAEIEQTLGGVAVPLSPDEIGEETAPSCQWATKKRDVRVKIEIWSPDELPVLGLPDAESYYAQLERDADVVTAIEGLGQRAFEFVGAPYATIVVLRDNRLIVFAFEKVPIARARAFAAASIARM